MKESAGHNDNLGGRSPSTRQRLKSRLEVENFSGKSVLAVKQDFYAKIMTYNLEALVANVALVKVNEETKHCQHDYAVNHAQALSRLKGAWVKLMRRPVVLLSGFIMQLVKLVAAYRESIRPDRSYERVLLARKKPDFQYLTRELFRWTT
jgi:hypothetical protein